MTPDADTPEAAWARAAKYAADIREERRREWQARPLAERLRIALEMVQQRDDDDPPRR